MKTGGQTWKVPKHLVLKADKNKVPKYRYEEVGLVDEASSEDELNARPGMWRGNSKRMTKKGKPTKDELGMQANLKQRIKMQKKQGGLTGPRDLLPEQIKESKYASTIGAISAAEYQPKIGDKIRTRKGGQIPGTVTSVTDTHVHFKHPEGKTYKTSINNVMREEIEQIEESKKPTHLVRFTTGIHADEYSDHEVHAKDDKEAVVKAIEKHRKNYPYHSKEMLKINARTKKLDESYEAAQKHLDKASKALETSDMDAHHQHMSNHFEELGKWHDSKGRGRSAQKAYDKAEEHHEQSLKPHHAKSVKK
jgi:hypothetical protein